ncbi:M4 family metallopeptidase [Kibdelosporangium lantanae]
MSFRKLRRAGLAAIAGATLVAGAVSANAGQPAAPSPLAMAADAASSLVAARPAALHASADDTFTQRQAIPGAAGLSYVPYERTYKGLPVYGGDFVVVTKSGQVLDTSVAQDQTINLASTTALVRKETAEATARGQLPRTDRVEGTRQVVYALGTPRLAWETTVVGADKDGPSRLTVLVDAATGAVLHTQEHVMKGDGNTAWNGPKPVHLDTTKSGSNYSLTDPAHPTEKCQDAANNQTFTKTTDSFGNGNATSKETGCADAFFDIQVENKMLAAWLNRNSFDGNGGGWPIRVGLNDLNAYYDGSQVQIGHNQQNQWISSLDVVGHEHGHGIDDHTPGGISGSGTQEFVADVFGAATEWYANEPAPYDTPDFLVGETINLVGSGPIRNMYNPSALGHKNCYDSSIPNTEVHAAAGPGNHWFYLLAEGTNPTDGQPASTTCNGSKITGVGIQEATKIFYNAMLMKTSGSSYLRYRTWTLAAAKNLTPGNCTDFNTVKAAWDAVSVPAQSGDPTCTSGPSDGPTVTNPGAQTTVVGTPVNLQLNASGGTAPLHWTATGLPTGLSISDGGLVSGTPTEQKSFSVTATATDSASPAKSGSASFTWVIQQQGGGGGCTAPEWNASTSYQPGDQVTHNGHQWDSTWYSTGAEPGAPGSWAVWSDKGAC